MGDEENAGSMLGKFGVMMGKGAAKAGKKAAQSEAGRRATKAAITGACDGVKEDMISRYGPPTSPTSTTPKSPTPQSAPAAAPPPSNRDSDDEVEPASSYVNSSYSTSSTSYNTSSSAHRPAQRRSSGPPKPSFFNRLNFLKKDTGGKAPRPRIRKDPKDRVYKQRLASTPDWDRLPLAQTLYNFKGEMRCDLEFRKGQVIQVMTRTETQEDWWEGRLEGRVGIFPANYVKLLS